MKGDYYGSFNNVISSIFYAGTRLYRTSKGMDHTWTEKIASQFGEMITGTLSQATTPIVSMILFILGYDLNVDKKTLVPILKLMGIKIVYYAMVIAGFFILFPAQMADKTFMMAPIIYFMCPTGFGLMPVIAPLYKDEDDASFTSAFVSIFMIITLIVYTLVVIFIA